MLLSSIGDPVAPASLAVIHVQYVEHITRMHIAQSIDLLLVYNYDFVNFREIMELLLSFTGSAGDT